MSRLVKGIPSEYLGLILYILPAKGEGGEYLGGYPANSLLVKGIPPEYLGLTL